MLPCPLGLRPQQVFPPLSPSLELLEVQRGWARGFQALRETLKHGVS